MDVQEILEQKIRSLPPGPHLDGLRAVKAHVEAAVRHLVRGQNDLDESLFTDVIFRCNQAFEGSIKEAYRVIAEKDPQKKSPAEIEKFLVSSNLLRKKVLDQFTNYRTEWRNPSTHDYTLDFDEDEALIAIVSVTVFAIVLCDQIASKLAFETAAAGPAGKVSAAEKAQPLLELATSRALSFATQHVDSAASGLPSDYYRLEGALAGYLAAELEAASDVTVTQNKRLGRIEADILLERGDEKVVIELKRTSSPASARSAAAMATGHVTRYLGDSGIIGGVVLVYSGPDVPYEVTNGPGPLRDALRIVAPIRTGISAS